MMTSTHILGIEHYLSLSRSQELSRICRNFGIRRLCLFGSVLRDEQRPGSDLDILVEFLPGHTPGFAFAQLGDQLSHLFGAAVDLHTPQSLSRYFRHDVLQEAREIYAAEE